MPLTSVSLRNSTWMDGVQVSAQDLRLQQSGAFLTGASPSGSTGIAARPGVRYGTGDGLKISASSGMTLAVNPGVVWVQGSAAANSGMYEGILDTANTVTLATSDPTNPRIDNIIVQFTDLGTSSSSAVVTPQTGTPAASPVAPTLPANSLLLAQVSVAASTSSIVAGNITDKRVWTVATGGIVPMANVTGGITGQAGLYAHDLSTGRLKVSDGSGNAKSPKVAAFTPVLQAPGNFTVTSTGSYQNVVSAIAPATDATEMEVIFTYSALSLASGSPVAGNRIDVCFSIGSAQATWAGSYNGFFHLYDNGSGLINGGAIRSWIAPSSSNPTTIYVTSILGQSGATYMINSPNLRLQPGIQY